MDSDCGPCGYCSPSEANAACECFSVAMCALLPLSQRGTCSPGPCSCADSCGHGYFCHTLGDTCVDDSDCGKDSGNTDLACNYDVPSGTWTCSVCLGPL